MATESRVEGITKAETTASWRLWFGALGGGAAWFSQLVTNYSLEEWFACSTSALEPGRILGWNVDVVATIANIVFLLLAAAAALAAFSCLRAGSGDAGVVSQRARWMARAGLIADLMFLAIMVWGFAPPAILGICEIAP